MAENFENNVTDFGTNSRFCHFLLVLRSSLGDIHWSLSIHAVPCSFLPCELIEMRQIQDLVARRVFIFYFFFSSTRRRCFWTQLFSVSFTVLHAYTAMFGALACSSSYFLERIALWTVRDNAVSCLVYLISFQYVCPWFTLKGCLYTVGIISVFLLHSFPCYPCVYRSWIFEDGYH